MLSIFVVLVVLLVTLGTSYISSREIIKQTGDVSEQKIRIITRDIDEKISAVMNQFAIIRDHDELQRLMIQNDSTPEEAYERKRQISSILRQYAYSDITINSIFAFSLDKEIYDPLYLIPPYSEIVSKYQAFDEFIESGEFSRLSEPTTFPNKLEEAEENSKTTITYFSEYINHEDYTKIGYILINIKKEHLFIDIKTFLKREFDGTYVINEKGNVIYQTGDLIFTDEIIRTVFQEPNRKNDIERIDGEKYLIYSENLRNYPDWRVVGVMSYDRVRKNAIALLKISYFVTGVGIVLALLMSLFLSKKITDPVLEINVAMEQFQKGEWPNKLEATTNDELKSLVQGFNNMMDKFKDLIQQVYYEQREKKKVEVKTLQLKLDLLQSQINPHFVHNTLNAMQYLALKRGAYDIREMIQSFNILLRASMSVGKDYITIKEELDCIKSYIKIQGYRYGNEFNVRYDVDERFMQYKIPKLILQPLVENALYHGILPKENEGTIVIKIIESAKGINIRIIDDGVGISHERINKILEHKGGSTMTGLNNIGIFNINERLKLYFGEGYQLGISSNSGIGTCFYFDIPLMIDETFVGGINNV